MNSQAIGATEATLQNAVNDLDSLQALRRIVVLLESQACVDSGGRQRISLDGVNAGLTIPQISNISSVSLVTNLAAIANMDHRQFMDGAQTTFANAIRSKLN